MSSSLANENNAEVTLEFSSESTDARTNKESISERAPLEERRPLEVLDMDVVSASSVKADELPAIQFLEPPEENQTPFVEEEREPIQLPKPRNVHSVALHSEQHDESNARRVNQSPELPSDTSNDLKQSDSGGLVLALGESDDATTPNDTSTPDDSSKNDTRFFSCGSCKNNPMLIGSTPKLLPCLHSFCENCLQERYEKQRKSSEAAGVQSTPRLKCPSCGQEFLVAGSDRPTSGFLNNQFVIESTKAISDGETEDHPCTSCDDKSTASSYCMNCTEWLCDVCVNAHLRVKITKDHVIQSKADRENLGPKSPDSDNTSSKEKPLFCKIHPQEQLKLFCANCDKLTCRDCQLVEHKDHRYQFIEEAASKHREILKKLLQYLQINLGLLKETIVDVEKVSDGLSAQGTDVETEVNKAFDLLVDAIRRRQQTLVKELKNLIVSKQALLSKQKKDLTQMRVILEHNHDFAEFAVNGGSNVALLYSRKVLGTRLHNLNSLKYRQRPLAYTDLKFSMDVDKLCSYFSKTGAVYSQEDIQRKIDHYNNPKANAAATGRSSVPHSGTRGHANYNQSPRQPVTPIEGLNAVNKRLLTETSHTITSETPYINLSNSSALLTNRRMQNMRPVPNAVPNTNRVSPMYESNNRRPSSSGVPRSSSSGIVVMPNQNSVPNVLPDSSGMSKTDFTAKYIQHLKDNNARLQSMNQVPQPNNSLVGSLSKVQHRQSPSQDVHNRMSSPNAVRRPMHSTMNPWPGTSASTVTTTNGNGSIDELQKLVADAGANPQLMNAINRSNITLPPPNASISNSNSGASNNAPISIKQEIGDANMPLFSLSSNQDDAQSRESKESGFDENQTNEDYCGVCRNGGQLLCCDTCPKVYHLQCHVPTLTILPNDSWSCGLCQSSPNINKGGFASGKRRSSLDGLTDGEIKICEKLLLHMFVHADSLPFHHKVSKTQVPDYYKVITKPMDFTTILSKIQPQNFSHYKSMEEFVGDMRLVFTNCFVYNSSESDVWKMGKNLESHFDVILKKHVPWVNPHPEPEAESRAKQRKIETNEVL